MSSGFNLLFLSVGEKIKDPKFQKSHQIVHQKQFQPIEIHDNEEDVRRAIRYLYTRMGLKSVVEEPDSVISYYNVISYTYEYFDQKHLKTSPMSEVMFKVSVDTAIEKSIRVKAPFGKIVLTSLSVQLEKIRNFIAFDNRGSGLASGNFAVQQSQLQKFFSSEKVLDTSKQTDMRSFFYFKYLFNNTLYQLFENFFGIAEQTHLIPFDQLSEFEREHVLLLKETLPLIREQLDKLFLRHVNGHLRACFRRNFFYSYNYQNVLELLQSYYANIIDLKNSPSEENMEAFHELSKDIVDQVHKHFTFQHPPEKGIVGNWQAIFVKLLDQLISIFKENDIPLLLSDSFQYKYDTKSMRKIVLIEFEKMNSWLKQLKLTNEQVFHTNSKNSLKRPSQYQDTLDLYNELVAYNDTYLVDISHDSVQVSSQHASHSSLQNSLSEELVSESSNQSEISISSSQSDQNPNFIRKRRTACLVLNEKDDISDNLLYSEKIKRLMRGEISSPTRLDDSFV